MPFGPTDDSSSPMEDAAEFFELADGRQLEVRPTTAADGELLCGLFAAMTVADRSRRFFSAFKPRLEWCRHWAEVGSRGGFGVIAIVHERAATGGGVVAGEAGYAIRADGDGDLAVTVAETWRGWLGPYLVDVLVRHASAHGLANLQADVLLENGPMLAILRRRGPVALEHDSGAVRLSIGTSGSPPSWPRIDDRRRVLVEVAGGRWSGERAANDAGLSTVMCPGPSRRGRDGCPVLEGGRCRLADGADAIIVLLDPDDNETAQLIESHRRMSPGVPILVRRAYGQAAGADHAEDSDSDGAVADGCIEVDSNGSVAVGQVLSLVGHRVSGRSGGFVAE
jgi:hypothetical protein